MPHFAKPAEGSWTEHYPQLGTAPVSYEDSISPEYYEREREAIFARTWLNVGRVEQLPRVGSYFTKEIDAARTSIVVVRAADQQVRAFYNMCRHRGNKLVWQDYPGRRGGGHVPAVHRASTTAGATRLEGDLTFVQQEARVLRPRQGRLRPRAGTGRDVGGVHLREPRPQATRRRSASTSASSARASRATRSAR